MPPPNVHQEDRIRARINATNAIREKELMMFGREKRLSDYYFAPPNSVAASHPDDAYLPLDRWLDTHP
jgi:hypothetical protein